MITITNQPHSFYPAYNDSFLAFTATGSQRAVIIFDDTYQFTIFPDGDGNYLFNMREVVKALVNPEQFKDQIVLSSSWGYSDASLFKSIRVEIIVGEESLIQNYTFTKAVKQFGDRELENPYQLLLPSDDGLNYHLTYFEGFPFELPFRYVNGSDSISIENQRTKQVSRSFSPSLTNPYRLFIDKGMTNWHSAGILELPDMMSRLYIRENGENQTALELTKKANQCGKYIKWFNSDGGYSYWLFNQWFKQDFSGSEIDRIGTNNYNNVYDNQEGLTKITGKSGSQTLQLKTSLTAHEVRHLSSLVTSPHVQIWSESDPYQDGYWIDVKVNTSTIPFNNKKPKNHITVEIQLPDTQTQVL